MPGHTKKLTWLQPHVYVQFLGKSTVSHTRLPFALHSHRFKYKFIEIMSCEMCRAAKFVNTFGLG